MRTTRQLLEDAAHWLAVPPTSNSDRYAVGELLKELQAAQPAPLADAELQALATLSQDPALPMLPWSHAEGYNGAWLVDFLSCPLYDGMRITWGENYGQGSPTSRAVAKYLAAAANALPGLLARLARAEAKLREHEGPFTAREQLENAINEAENSFGYGSFRDGLTQGHLNKLRAELAELDATPTETVKGGQQDA